MVGGQGQLGEWAGVVAEGPRRSGRSLRERAWIPVSAHENDEGCAPDGGARTVSRYVCRSPLLNPPPVGEEVKRDGEVGKKAEGARTPSSILPRRAEGGGKTGEEEG